MSLFIFRSKRMKHVRGLLRAGGYLSVTALAFSAYSIKVARAEMKQTSLVIGREMLSMVQATHNTTTPISLNGQMMYMGSTVSDEGVDTILDRYEAACKADPGQPHRGWQEIEKANGGPLKDAPDLATTGAMRAGNGGREGMIMCFVRGENTKATTQEAWDNFMSTGELGALGRVRYVYARKTENGKTHLLSAWTESKFNLVEMMPEEGKDVPGTDFPEIPRVPSSSRVISAHAEGLPYGVNVYKTTESAQQTLAFYDQKMTEAGWRGIDPEMDAEKDGGLGRNYLKDGIVLTIGTKTAPEGNFVALGLAGVGADSSPKPSRTVSREDDQ